MSVPVDLTACAAYDKRQSEALEGVCHATRKLGEQGPKKHSALT